MTTYDFKCGICGETRLLVDNQRPESPSCCNQPMNSYTWAPNTSKNAQLHPKDRPVVFENPQTGEVRYPARQDSPMMPGYKERGFERKEFTSYAEHKKWCDKNQVVNHGLEGIK